eukprot:scaffold994_cov242-Pinguiococcus_pyrenoidosus.AAC.3
MGLAEAVQRAGVCQGIRRVGELQSRLVGSASDSTLVVLHAASFSCAAATVPSVARITRRISSAAHFNASSLSFLASDVSQHSQMPLKERCVAQAPLSGGPCLERTGNEWRNWVSVRKRKLL